MTRQRARLNPKNDFLFQRLFGEKESKESTISLLNAILGLNEEERIKDLVLLENKQLTKEQLEDKAGRLDVRARAVTGESQYDLEIQLRNEFNMPQRTLFYAGKMIVESVKQGGDYLDMPKIITINIVNYTQFEVEKFHTTFHLYEDGERELLLTDVMEIHFLEHPKFRKGKKDAARCTGGCCFWMTRLRKIN